MSEEFIHSDSGIPERESNTTEFNPLPCLYFPVFINPLSEIHLKAEYPT